MKLKPIITIICLTVLGVAGLHYNVHEITFTAVGAIAAWGFVNGVKNEIQKKENTNQN